MIKKILVSTMLLGALLPATALADNYVDDIYFNPKKDKNVGATKKEKSNYIANFSDMDVDAYNLRGQYYSSPVDTIGTAVGEGDDFVYTQQIQKYYNPTIVLDNSELLADVLDNSYGNVEIVYNGLTPAFMPVYGYGWPYYSSIYRPWGWDISFGWGGWNFGWYDPWYWGPSYAWGPSWGFGPSWGWGPSWGFGPSWGWGGPVWGAPAWGGGHRPGNWNPGGNRPNNPSGNWATSTRPGAGYNHRTMGTTGTSGNRQNAATGNNRGYTIGNNGHRYTGSGNTNTTVNTNRNNGYNSNSGSNHRGNSGYNTNTTTNRSTTTTTRSNSSYNSNRSSGNGSFGSGSFGGGRSSGGGSHSSGGRGGRR